jgi:hypothetical protein
LQDIKNLDSRGVPGGFVASEVFVEAAESQADAVGLRPRALFVPHPIQDRTDKELKTLADAAFADVYALVCSTPC